MFSVNMEEDKEKLLLADNSEAGWFEMLYSQNGQ